jgi:hypothetical protein
MCGRIHGINTQGWPDRPGALATSVANVNPVIALDILPNLVPDLTGKSKKRGFRGVALRARYVQQAGRVSFSY